MAGMARAPPAPERTMDVTTLFGINITVMLGVAGPPALRPTM